jgi:hypothetical protein
LPARSTPTEAPHPPPCGRRAKLILNQEVAARQLFVFKHLE